MTNENLNYQYSSLKWAFEMELVSNPQVINTMKMNLMGRYKAIKEVEFLIMKPPERILLAHIDLKWFHRKFFSEQICLDCAEILQQLLPNFKIRVVSDRSIFEMALEKLEALEMDPQNGHD